MNKNKLILFDLGGVVIDIDFSRTWAHWRHASGQDLAHAEERLGPASTDNQAFHEFERGTISEAEFYRRTAERTGLTLALPQWRAGWNALFIGELPGTQRLLSELQGHVRLMALSNINAAHHAHTVQHFSHLLEKFEKVFYSHEIGARKPDREAFELIANETGISPANTLFFDDMPGNVAGARAAGLKAELFRDAAQAREVAREFLASGRD